MGFLRNFGEGKRLYVHTHTHIYIYGLFFRVSGWEWNHGSCVFRDALTPLFADLRLFKREA